MVRGIDTTVLPNREVRFEYSSNGSVKQENLKRVNGEFSSVDLTLVIEELGIPVFTRSVTSACSLKGRINKEGDQGKSRLRCKLGDDMSDLDLDLPGNAQYRDNVEDAFPKQPHIKVLINSGKLRVNHDGEPAPGGVTIVPTCVDPD